MSLGPELPPGFVREPVADEPVTTGRRVIGPAFIPDAPADDTLNDAPPQDAVDDEPAQQPVIPVVGPARPASLDALPRDLTDEERRELFVRRGDDPKEEEAARCEQTSTLLISTYVS
jgi:hypothetical protein